MFCIMYSRFYVNRSTFASTFQGFNTHGCLMQTNSATTAPSGAVYCTPELCLADTCNKLIIFFFKYLSLSNIKTDVVFETFEIQFVDT